MHQTVMRGIAALALLVTLAAPGFAQPVEIPKLPELPAPEIPTLPEAELPPLEAPTPIDIPSAPSAEIPAAPGADDAPEQVEADYGHNIRIEGTPEFVRQSVALLDTLATLPTGKEILAQLGATGNQTVIRRTEDMNAYASPLDRANLDAATYDAEGKAGEGTDALVQWNPEFKMDSFTPEIVMGHELIHALHIHKGELNMTRQHEGDNIGTRLEELRTIGTDGFEDEALSENALRKEWNAAYPDRQVPTTRTGHGADDFAPEEDHEHEEPTAQSEPTTPTPTSPADTSPKPERSYEGLSDVLKRHLGGK